jgi:hypothetical protein
VPNVQVPSNEDFVHPSEDYTVLGRGKSMLSVSWHIQLNDWWDSSTRRTHMHLPRILFEKYHFHSLGKKKLWKQIFIKHIASQEWS